MNVKRRAITETDTHGSFFFWGIDEVLITIRFIHMIIDTCSEPSSVGFIVINGDECIFLCLANKQGIIITKLCAVSVRASVQNDLYTQDEKL